MPPAVAEQSQGIHCQAIMWLANEILAQGVACGLSASTSGVSYSPSMQTQPNGQSLVMPQAALQQARPQQTEMVQQPSDGAPLVDVHASMAAHEQAAAQQQQLQTGSAVPVCSGSTAQQSQPAGLHEPLSATPTPGHMHGGGEGPPLSAALPDNAGSAVPVCSGNTAQQSEPAGLSEPFPATPTPGHMHGGGEGPPLSAALPDNAGSAVPVCSGNTAQQSEPAGLSEPFPATPTPGHMHGGSEGPLLSAALPDNAIEPMSQVPQPEDSPGEEQAEGYSGPGTEQDQPHTGSNSTESSPTGGVPAANTPRKTRMHRKKNPPQPLSKTHRPLAVKPTAPGVPPPLPTNVPRGMSGPGLLGPSQSPTEEPQHQKPSGPRQAPAHATHAEPPTESQPVVPPVRRSPTSTERQEQKVRQTRRTRAPSEEPSPGKIPRLRNLNLISGPSRLTGSPTKSGRAGRPRAGQAEVGGAGRLSLSPSAKKQRTGQQTAGTGEGGSAGEGNSRDDGQAGAIGMRVVSPVNIQMARPQQPRRTSPRQLAAVQPFSPQLLALAELATDGG